MFLRNVDLKTSEIGFGTLWEVILEGLAPKGPKRRPKAVQRLFKKSSKEPKGLIRGAPGTQKGAQGHPRGSQSVSENSPYPVLTQTRHRA